MDKMLSVVLPAYNEEQMIKKTSQVVGDLLEKEQIPYELVFVNDGSKDHTWEKILELKEESFMGRRISGDRGSESIQRKRKFHSQDVCKNILQYYQ